jgi:hypothetical protein
MEERMMFPSWQVAGTPSPIALHGSAGESAIKYDEER